MSSKWIEVPLGQVLTLQRGFDLPIQDRRPGRVPVISSSGVTDYHDLVGVKAPGVVTGRYGTIGKVFFVKEDYWPLNTTLWVKDFKGNDPRFAAYLLQTIDFQSCSDKSSVPGVNRNDLHRISVLLPPISEQKAIAGILGALDDKIELNRRMNETLEAMARAIFKSWFVDFDPVRAKTEGCTPAGMDAETAALFPDSFVKSKIGDVPIGWPVERFDAHITADKGLSYKGEGLRDDPSGLPMHNLNSIYEGGGYKFEGIKYYAGEHRERHIAKVGDMIVTNTEQGFDHLLIGHAAIVPDRFGSEGLFSHHIYRVRVKKSSPMSAYYLVELFNHPRWHYWISGFSNGTTINMLPLDALQMPLLVVPPAKLVERFTEFARAIDQQCEANRKQSITLSEMRDTLLPKLLSGEVRVKDAERTVTDAVE